MTTTELLTLDATELGKRTQLPLLDLRRLCDAVLRALQSDLGVAVPAPVTAAAAGGQGATVKASSAAASSSSLAGTTINSLASNHHNNNHSLRNTHAQLAAKWSTISTLDPELDAALGGGIPTGCVTEITGESGAGKTQLLLSLLLAVQLAPPHGLGRKAMYIPTEAALSTTRVSQILASNPLLASASPTPSLDSILSLETLGDLESQDHILTYQVPIEAARRGVGLIILDSVAANFRAEFDPASAARTNGLAARSANLVRLGMQLRNLARSQNLAVVVANQVADRFESRTPMRPRPPLFAAVTSTSTTTTTSGDHQSKSKLGESSSNAAVGGEGGGATNITRGPIRMTQESPLASRSRPLPSTNNDLLPSSSLGLPEVSWPRPVDPYQQSGPEIPALLLDHQQRWFTGWGDDEDDSVSVGSYKTPSLGLVWSTQISARIALLKKPAYGRSGNLGEGGDSDMITTRHSWRRWMKVVFAPHVAPSGPGLDGAIEYEICNSGLRGITASHSSGKTTAKRKRID